MTTWHGAVVRTEWLTPSLLRVVLGGEGLRGFALPPATDAYVNVAIPPSGATYGPVFEPADVRARLAPEQWPARRRYTVRAWDADSGELALDMVVHGDRGAGGPWAAGCRRGDVLVFEGPGGGYAPDPDAAWHLLLGDESALPAIATALAAVPAGRRAVVRLVCDGPEHEVALPTEADLDLVWLHRNGDADDADLLAASVRALDFPAGRAQAFVHGEADEIRAVRRHLLGERGLTRADMSCSPYWRRTMTDEAWRAVKRDFVTAMEADV